MRYAALLLCGFALSACVEPVGRTTASVLNGAERPSYVIAGNGETVPAHCLKPRVGGFGTEPPGCRKARVFADQVAYEHDLTRPHVPGATSPSIVAGAALDYLTPSASVGETAAQ